MFRRMRTSICTAALVTLFALPAWAEAHCAAMGPANELILAVSVPGDFRACVTKLMQGAKQKCGAGPELKLTVTGSENGKEADLRVLRVDCGKDGGVSRPLPPNLPPRK
jgi:hypothetical protein